MAVATIEPVDVWELARRRFSRRGEIPVRALPRLASQLVEGTDRLCYRLTGEIDDRGRPSAWLELDGTVHAVCDRCGEPVAMPISERARFFFVANEEELARLPIDDAPDEPLLGSQHFDLAALIEDQAILALPISPRHDGCAAASQEDLAPARGDGIQRPFEALAKLKKRGS